MFVGEYDYSADERGRISVPARYREGLGERFFVTAGLDGCLVAYPTYEWETFAEDLSKLSQSAEGRRLQRHFLSNAAECDTDKHGRILLPQGLREKAGFDKDITFVGVGNKVELWDTAKYRSVTGATSEEDVSGLLEKYNIRY